MSFKKLNTHQGYRTCLENHAGSPAGLSGWFGKEAKSDPSSSCSTTTS